MTISGILLIAFIAGFVHSAIGFGFGIVAVSLLPWVIDAKQTQLVVSLASIPVMIAATWAYRDGSDKKTLLHALLGALIGLPLGLWLFQSLKMDWLVRGTGLAILVMLAMNFRNRRGAIEEGKSNGIPGAAGAAAGFLAGAVSIAGPPIVAYALQQKWSQARLKAFVNQFLLAVCVLKVGGLVVVGEIGRQSLIQSMWFFRSR